MFKFIVREKEPHQVYIKSQVHSELNKTVNLWCLKNLECRQKFIFTPLGTRSMYKVPFQNSQRKVQRNVKKRTSIKKVVEKERLRGQSRK